MTTTLRRAGRRVLPSKAHSVARWSYLALLAARRRISVLARSYYYTGNAVQCPFCKGRFRRFLPTGVLDREFWQSEEGRATLSLDFVTVCNQQCPRCGSSERHRLAYFFLKDKIDSEALAGASLLDVAPDRFVTEALFDQLEIDYTSVDLARPNATHRMDVTALEFDDDSFDWIVCYHVLEHVEDDRKAMSELCRVLKPGGRAILQVPIWSDATFEDEGAGRADYLRLYGHHDHVRRYGLDYKDRLESAGFDVTLDGYVRTLSKETARRYGLLENEDIYVCGKARVRTGNSTELAVTPSTPVSTE